MSTNKTLVIGKSAEADVTVDLDTSTHTVLVGGTGVGKSTAARVMMDAARHGGFDIIRHTQDSTTYLYGTHTPIRTMHTTSEVLEYVYEYVQTRTQACVAVDKKNWKKRSSSLKPMLVVLDDLKLSDDNRTLLSKLIREAHHVGVNLVLSIQNLNVKEFSSSILENVGNRVLFANANSQRLDVDSVRLFGDKANDAVTELQNAVDGMTPGIAVTLDDSGEPKAFRFHDKVKDF